MHAQLHEVKRLMQNTGTNKWWIDQGTLLGVRRDGDLIPWDKDIDLCVPEHEAEALIGRLQEGLAKDHGYRVNPVHALDRPYMVKLAPDPPDRLPVDVSICFDHGDDYVHYAYPIPCQQKRRLSPGWFKQTGLGHAMKVVRRLTGDMEKARRLPLLRRHFPVVTFVKPKRFFEHLRDLQGLPSPDPAEEYLATLYGDDWQTPTRQYLYYRDCRVTRSGRALRARERARTRTAAHAPLSKST